MVSIYFYYFYYFLLCRNIQTKNLVLKFWCISRSRIGQWVPTFPIMLTLPVGLFPIWVSWPLAEDLLPIAYLGYYFLLFLMCTIIWNIQTKIAFWCIFARGIGQWFPASPSCLRCLWVCYLAGSHAWGSLSCLGCHKFFACETRVLHSTPQSLTYWLRSFFCFFCPTKKDRKKKTGAHRPFPREKNLYLFSSFFTYTSKYQNVTLFFDWMSLNASRIVSGQSALKTAEKSESILWQWFKVDQLMSNRPSHDRYFPDFQHAVWLCAV